MKTVTSIKDLKLALEKNPHAQIGFVPTMGDLHQGHLSLVKTAKSQSDFVVVSVFVNPTQFNNPQDLENYKINLDSDKELLKKNQVDLLFAPTPDVMYPEGFSTYVEENAFTQNLCGASRPGHFKGVTTIVAKLFNLIKPQKAFFGLKDYQQFLTIKKMATDLNFDVEIIPVPIVREEDGLALSSRNKRLSDHDRFRALSIYKSLLLAEQTFKKGERNLAAIKELVRQTIDDAISDTDAFIDYIEFVDADHLGAPIPNSRFLIAVAVQFSNCRLIDNRVIEP